MKLKLPNFEHAKVMVIGDIILDRYWYGSTTRISTEAPVPVVKIETVEERPGGAANVAVNIASLGANSRLVGITGIDDAARVLANTLAKVNVKCDFISVPTHSTIAKLRVLSQNQQLIRLDLEEKFSFVDFEPLYERVNQALQNINMLVLSDYAKGTLTSTNIQKIIQLAHKSDVPILIDPKCTNFEIYRGATLLTPNLFEFEAVVGKCKGKEDIFDKGRKIITDFELTALLVTCSEQGMILLQLNKPPLYIPARSHEVYDVTGAGDTVIGVLAATMAAGKTLEEACYAANVAAGIVVGKLGTSSVSPSELKNAIDERSENDFGIITEEELKIAVATAHKRGEKIVMTNGVFDILHTGHVSCLSKARKLGDRLIVAVNSDASTKRLKGKTRPINSLKDRMIVLSALKFVDWVVSFEEDTPDRLIANISPDFLVKGGDYKLEQIIGNRESLSNDIVVMVLNFESNYSTSEIVKKIKKMKVEDEEKT